MMPPEILASRERSTNFGVMLNKTLITFVPKKIVKISSIHHDTTINEDSRKPEIMMFYNSTKAGVDALDEKCAIYSNFQKNLRCPWLFFTSY